MVLKGSEVMCRVLQCSRQSQNIHRIAAEERWHGLIVASALGGAIKRSPSRAASILVKRNLVIGRTLDYGCGYGLDAATFGWDAYDPYHRPNEPAGPYDTIVCTLVLNALSRNNRAKVLARIQVLLAEDGRAYLGVARDLPSAGKLGMHHSLQNYVVLMLPSVYADAQLDLLKKTAMFTDKTGEYMSRRARRMRVERRFLSRKANLRSRSRPQTNR
jgi:hypothetical protein